MRTLLPLPTAFVATKHDMANDMFEVKRLEDEFGFKYGSMNWGLSMVP
jgi:hypothetical protein